MRLLARLLQILSGLPMRWRLALVSLGLMAVLLTALGLVIPVTEGAALLDGQANALQSQAYRALFSSASAGVQFSDGIDWSAFHHAIAQQDAVNIINGTRKFMGTDSTIGVAVLTPDGRVIEGGQDVWRRPEVVLPPARVKSWFATHQRYMLMNNQRGEREIIVLQPFLFLNGAKPPVSSEDKKTFLQNTAVGFLQLSSPTTQIDQSVASLRLELTMGILAALGIAMALTLPLIRGALRPLVEIERASTRIASGEFSLRLATSSHSDEIGRLASAFNRMVERLDEIFTRQKRFVSDVSHELRTPLTALGGSLEMLLLEADDGDVVSRNKLMRGMYAEVERMQRLVGDLLVLSRLDEGQMRLRGDVVDVGSLVGELCEQARQLSQGQDICARIAPALPKVRGDQDQLRRVLLNLIENALKFTPVTGQIALDARAENATTLLIEVSDTGIGIPAQALPYVFDRFYRVDAARLRGDGPGGSGLGLSIVQALVHAHGGTIHITSTPGCGTQVMIRLPAKPGK